MFFEPYHNSREATSVLRFLYDHLCAATVPQRQQNTEANTIIVNEDGQSDFVDLSRVNFDVTIPSTETLQLKTATGCIEVSERWSSHAIPGQLTCVMAQ